MDYRGEGFARNKMASLSLKDSHRRRLAESSENIYEVSSIYNESSNPID
jgi:hypothetical protein